MRIGMIFSTPFPPREGIGFYVWNLAQELKRQGHDVLLITRGAAKKTWCEVVEGIPVWKPPFIPIYPFHAHLHGWYVDKLLSVLSSELDILHLHTPLVKKPDVNLPQLVTVHTTIMTGVASFAVNDLWTFLNKIQAPISKSVEKPLLLNATRLVCVAKSVSNELRAYGINPDSSSVLGNLVDTSVFFPTNFQLSNNDIPYILTVGRLAPRKGLEDLISCAEIVKSHGHKVRFLIAGEGPLEQKIGKMIRAKDLEATVQLLGLVSNRNLLANLYRNSTAYMHPAHYEGLPTAVLEAMACGVPVVATAVSGIPDVIENNVNGILVPPHAPDKLADRITRIIQNQDFGKQLGKNARETIINHYSCEIVAQKYAQEYYALIEKKHTRF
jgi:glycosyltransferase involved in cell wall biosynthesis